MPDSLTGKPPVVLLVEDEVLIRMDVADILTDAGYRVIAEVNADHALTVLDVRSDIEAIFTDVTMPGCLDGVALARLVDMRWPGIGIVVTSGKGRPGPGELPIKARFIPKPYPQAVLLQAIEDALGTSARQGLNGTKPTQVSTGAALLPAGIKIERPHMGIGAAGGLAQPLLEPEE